MNQIYYLPLVLIAIWFAWKVVTGTLRLVLILVVGITIFLVLRDSVAMYYLQLFS
jgi:hypothetical protein